MTQNYYKLMAFLTVVENDFCYGKDADDETY